ncbi:MAG: Na+-transporting NADH:ubiquinone oxidoreductase subunit A [Parvicella sp.]|jgi:Na+-transporting NADH:ubiquinone oxidoreductase subunit A
MSKTIKIRKGLDINLVGAAEKVIVDAPKSTTFAVKPPDFHGVAPKMAVKVGDSVKAGSVLFNDKNNLDINFASPVSGKLIDIKRGAKRKILEVVVEADNANEYEIFDTTKAAGDAESVKSFLLEAGLWPFIKMRPLDLIANPTDTPKAIFISGFNSEPLSPDYDFTLHGKDKEFQAGIDAIAKLTIGKVYLGLKNGTGDNALIGATGVEKISVSGPHPAGNVGVQIHHTSPINKGEVVWTVNAQDVALIGNTVLTGKFDATRLVALTGSNAKNRKYYRTTIGAQVSTIVTGNTETDNSRIVSGGPLTGVKIEADNFLNYYSSQVTVLEEGNRHKFFVTEGWLSPGLTTKLFSASRAYPSWMMPKSKKYTLDTNLNGEERAFVVTEQYEKVFPFDIFPVQLVKAAITNDIDNMEKLGIYEVAPEDFALCEFICTSKIESQKHIREALDLIKEECM